MSVFRLSKGVCRTYHSKVANYWWGSGGKKRGIHWCRWEVLCKNKKSGGLGFRDIEVFNQALLAKTLWRIVLHPESLVNQVLQAKYVIGGDWAGAVAGQRTSFIWKSLAWGKELLRAGMRWRIGNGTFTRIWEDKWLPVPWSFWVISPRFWDQNATVHLLMERPGKWNVDFIRNNFLEVDAEKILSIPICEGSGNDVGIWHYTKDGYYTVKSGYWLGMELKQAGVSTGCSGEKATSNSKSVWSIIWDLMVPNKVKLFLWRACHAFLPCAERLFKRKVCPSEMCGRCGGASESVIHSLWECPSARKVWKCTWLSGVVKCWKPLSFSDLFHRVAEEGTGKELELFALVAWWIWKCRNEVLHGKQEVGPQMIVNKCLDWQVELLKVGKNHYYSATSSTHISDGEQLKDIIQVSDSLCPIMFFDGAVNKDTKVGLGAVLLKPDKSLVGALSVPLNLPLSPIATEALALWHGLKFCKELNVERLMIKGDALNVLNGLKVHSWDLSEIGGILDAIRLLMSEFDWISWKHVKKRRNSIAHSLARSALSLSQTWFCKEDGPPWLHDVIAGN
ncbi:hypothetical protein ACLB2K_068949 [Fragaria x ananassa]